MKSFLRAKKFDFGSGGGPPSSLFKNSRDLPAPGKRFALSSGVSGCVTRAVPFFSVCGGRREKGSSDASTASLSFSLRKYVNSATAHGDTAIKTLSLSHRTKFGFGWLPRIFKKLPSSDARMLLKISLGRLLAPSAKYFPADNTRAFQLHSIVEEEIGKLDDLFIHLASSSPFI